MPGWRVGGLGRGRGWEPTAALIPRWRRGPSPVSSVGAGKGMHPRAGSAFSGDPRPPSARDQGLGKGTVGAYELAWRGWRLAAGLGPRAERAGIRGGGLGSVLEAPCPAPLGGVVGAAPAALGPEFFVKVESGPLLDEYKSRCSRKHLI